jgi:hypothetical protein
MLLISRDRREEHALTNTVYDAVVQQPSLGRRRELRPTDGARALPRDSQPPPPVTSQLLTGHHIILSQVHTDELGSQVEHD